MEVWKIILLIFFIHAQIFFYFLNGQLSFRTFFFAKKLSFRIEVEIFFFGPSHPSLYGFYSKALLLDPVQREAWQELKRFKYPVADSDTSSTQSLTGNSLKVQETKFTTFFHLPAHVWQEAKTKSIQASNSSPKNNIHWVSKKNCTHF